MSFQNKKLLGTKSQMASLDFRTHHNVVIKFEAASLLLRILAFGIDIIIVSISIQLLFSLLPSIEFLQYFIFTIFAMMYHLLFELFNKGQSPGKKILKLRVITLEGELPTPNQTAIRWIFRLIDIGMSLGLIAISTIISSARSQRLGDLMAGTTVIKRPETFTDKLTILEKLKDVQFEIKYCDMIQYNDKEMFLIKSLLERTEKNPTPENQEKIRLVTKKLATDLNIKYPEKAELKFIKQALQDYILLTR